jgi:hypothetical protein
VFPVPFRRASARRSPWIRRRRWRPRSRRRRPAPFRRAARGTHRPPARRRAGRRVLVHHERHGVSGPAEAISSSWPSPRAPAEQHQDGDDDGSVETGPRPVSGNLPKDAGRDRSQCAVCGGADAHGDEREHVWTAVDDDAQALPGTASRPRTQPVASAAPIQLTMPHGWSGRPLCPLSWPGNRARQRPIQNRRVMSTSSVRLVGCEIVRGSSAMPQMGRTRRIADDPDTGHGYSTCLDGEGRPPLSPQNSSGVVGSARRSSDCRSNSPAY